MTRADIVELLKQGLFEELKGATECAWLECKGCPYLLDTEQQKMEFAKDVSSMANGEGGLILLGARTRKSQLHQGEEIRDVSPYSQDRVDLDRYYKVAKEWIYPGIPGLDIKWYPSKAEPKNGIIAVEIPGGYTIGPFLVRKLIHTDGKTLGHAFAYFERPRDAVAPISVERFQGLIREALHLERFRHGQDELSEILRSMQTTLDRWGPVGVPQAPIEDVFAPLHRRIQEAVRHAGLEGRPSFTLGVTPVEAIDIPAVSRSDRSDLLRLLETPPKLRESGFDLYTGVLPELAEGARVRRAVVNGYKLLELWRDGTLIFVAPADERFLCWDIYYEPGKPYSVRPLVLVESTLLFCRLADRVYKLVERMPDHLQFALELRETDAHGQPARLKPGEDRLNVLDMEEPKVAPYGGNAFPVKLAAGTPPEVVAYQLVREVYAWFNYADNQVPYSEERDDQFRIVLDRITR